ncbi:tautomerase family protein [Thalassospira sp.]|uniref:tautomerase family protein n=1 Tax=Thalassospira sp. TaxID=1912094 RepID=UPI000C566CB0|nr:tautomerase family protein [Thalassospira sp.]MBC06119.1 4-oxalocrotonate tautomerase [Thalassospira sp.]|tara:strand:+ start:2685 stop:2912 length:228 start_codon:yes stop_codon:yes gene_type:complete
MPHVIVKAWPGKTEDEKKRLADAITKHVMEIFEYGDEAVSVAIEEVGPESWKTDVYEPDIKAKPNQLYKKPGYEM